MAQSEKGEVDDWAKNFTLLLSHTSLTKNDIKMSTIPFLEGIINNLPDELRRKHGYGGCPLLGIGGGTDANSEPRNVYKPAEKAPTINQIEAFINGSY
jgi:hypothetical protein